jgi:hypothetical protein
MEKSFLGDLGTVLGGVVAVLIIVLRPDLTPGFVHDCAAILPGKDQSLYEPIIIIGTFSIAGRIMGLLLGMLVTCKARKDANPSDP